jgi:hypothetical protein
MNRVKMLDFVERVSATFIQAFLGLALVTGLSDPKMLEAAGAAGAIAAGKYVYVEANAYLRTKPVKA